MFYTEFLYKLSSTTTR